MSHRGTNWAIQQRGLKPAAKIVLWHLCDRHNPDFGCFPEQKRLARDCEMSRSTLNLHLSDLEQRGLIRRERRWNEETRQQENTRYKLGFEDDFEPVAAESPCPETGHGAAADPVSEKDRIPCPKNDDSRVRKSDTNLVREPVREPVNSREGVREPSEEGEPARTEKQAETLFWKFVQDWPGFAGMPKAPALRAFLKLSEADQDEAIEQRDAWFALLRSQKKSHFPAPATYCGEKLWRDVPAGFAKAGEAQAAGEAKPWGKLWGAMRFADLQRAPYGRFPALTQFQQQLVDQGGAQAQQEKLERLAKYGWPKVNTMHERAVQRGHKGIMADPSLEPLAELFGGVAKGSVLWQAWKALHLERGWPWFGDDRGCPDFVWMPAPPEEPGTYASPLEAVRAAMERFETMHATISANEAAE